jgi:hypothetical protein
LIEKNQRSFKEKASKLNDFYVPTKKSSNYDSTDSLKSSVLSEISYTFESDRKRFEKKKYLREAMDTMI